MALNWNLVFGILSIIGSILAAYFSYGVYRYNRLSKAWLAVTVAFILVILERCIRFIADVGYFSDLKLTLDSLEGSILLIVSVLFIWGLSSMRKNFEKFDVVEKKAGEKAQNFNNNKK